MDDLLFFALVLAPLLAPCLVVGAAATLARRVWKQQPVMVGRLPTVTTCALVRSWPVRRRTARTRPV
ncbi:hypothetical protein [Streptomyces camponoticapitis]|uniref:hypothetical protein n=1 Tax=Streptomyces camponoticapitis TaxID=1616125 RepID=UPI001E28871C|nr:hypothetical protein [Streptomyces camponoticapitis]